MQQFCKKLTCSESHYFAFKKKGEKENKMNLMFLQRAKQFCKMIYILEHIRRIAMFLTVSSFFTVVLYIYDKKRLESTTEVRTRKISFNNHIMIIISVWIEDAA